MTKQTSHTVSGEGEAANRQTTKKRKHKKRSVILIALATLFLLLIFAGPRLLARNIYKANFGSRYETVSWMARDVSEFEGLSVSRSDFVSDSGQKIAGYLYTSENTLESSSSATPHGIVVISHGLGGGGHNSYMDVAAAMVNGGYIVFAYDATGNDQSEGDSVSGLPQGIIDLDYALRHVKGNPATADLPIFLFGHSWGAYSAGSVLSLHPDVRAAVLVAGFNQSSDIIEEEGRRLAGDGIELILPYMTAIEKDRFGPYAELSVEDGFQHSDAAILMMHSTDDEMISFENQFERAKNLHQDDPRFEFIAFEDRGHDSVYYVGSCRDYKNELNAAFEAYVETLDGELTAEIKTAWMNEHLDKQALFEPDSVVMDQILAFYGKHLS